MNYHNPTFCFRDTHRSRSTMTKKRSSVLPKKINELHHLINNAFSSSQPDSPIQRIHAEVEQRLTFLKNLLSAEMASDSAKQSYLENMSERVRELEAEYRGSGTAGSSTTISTIDHVDNVGDDDDNDGDSASNCSCRVTLLQEDDDVSDDLESTLGHDTGVCADLIEEKKTMPVTVFNNVLFEGKVDDDEFRDQVENVLFDDMYRNGASVEDEQEEMEEKQIKAYVDLKKSEIKKKKNLGFGKFCAAVVSGFLIGMFSMAFIIILEDEAYEGHGHFLAPT